MKKITVKQISIIGMLMAIQIILGRYVSISLPTVKIGFGFLPWTIIAVLYGPAWSAFAGLASDFLIAILGPFGYYPPMATTAILTGLIYGIFLHDKPLTWKRIILCVVLQSILCSVLLQTLWLSMLMNKAYMILIPTRLVQNLITIPVHVLCIKAVVPTVVKIVNKNGGTDARSH